MNGSLTDDDTMLRLIADGHGRLFLGHPASLLLPDRPFPSAAPDVWVSEGRERVPVRRRRAEGRVGRLRLGGKRLSMLGLSKTSTLVVLMNEVSSYLTPHMTI